MRPVTATRIAPKSCPVFTLNSSASGLNSPSSVSAVHCSVADSRSSAEKSKFKDDGKAPAESGDAGKDAADEPAKDGATKEAPVKEPAAATSEAKAEPAKGAASD